VAGVPASSISFRHADVHAHRLGLWLGSYSLPPTRGNQIQVVWVSRAQLVVKQALDAHIAVERQLAGALFERVALSPAKLSPLVRELHPRAASVFRDTIWSSFSMFPKTIPKPTSTMVSSQS